MDRKTMLKIDDLIAFMKEKKGIKFTILNEADAKDFMANDIYYTKLNAFRKNFAKYSDGPDVGKYVDLEYAYLKEQSLIDRELRRQILLMSLDIEHSIKLHLINDIHKNKEENGYLFVKKYLEDDKVAQSYLRRKLDYCYCREHIDHHKDNLPIWVFFEVIPLGELKQVYGTYYKMYPKQQQPLATPILEHLLNFRNAAAHNNCLTYDLRQKGEEFHELAHVLRKKQLLTKEMTQFLEYRFTQDFIGFIVVYHTFVKNKEVKQEAIYTLKKLVYDRMLEHKEYFAHNSVVTDTYRFCRKFLEDYFLTY